MKTSKSKLAKKRILSIDPGTKNFAVCCMDIKNNKTKIVHLDMFKNTINDLKNENRVALQAKFRKDFMKIIKLKPEIIIIERFQNRGRGMGSLVEIVSYMIGIISEIAHKLKIDLHLVVASQWKNKIARDTGQKMQTYYSSVKPVPPHMLDAYLIGEYYAGIKFSIKSLKRVKQYRSLL